MNEAIDCWSGIVLGKDGKLSSLYHDLICIYNKRNFRKFYDIWTVLFQNRCHDYDINVIILET